MSTSRRLLGSFVSIAIAIAVGTASDSGGSSEGFLSLGVGLLAGLLIVGLVWFLRRERS